MSSVPCSCFVCSPSWGAVPGPAGAAPPRQSCSRCAGALSTVAELMSCACKGSECSFPELAAKGEGWDILLEFYSEHEKMQSSKPCQGYYLVIPVKTSKQFVSAGLLFRINSPCKRWCSASVASVSAHVSLGCSSAPARVLCPWPQGLPAGTVVSAELQTLEPAQQDFWVTSVRGAWTLLRCNHGWDPNSNKPWGYVWLGELPWGSSTRGTAAAAFQGLSEHPWDVGQGHQGQGHWVSGLCFPLQPLTALVMVPLTAVRESHNLLIALL